MEFTKKELDMIKEYTDFINDPMSDGYTRVWLENKFKTSIDKMETLYKNYKKEKYKNITKEQAYDLIKERLDVYNKNKNFGCSIFPKEDIEQIVYSVKEER